MALDLGIDVRMGADGASDEVAQGRVGCLLRGDLAGTELILDDGVVGGEEREMTGAETITAAVPYVGEPKFAGLGVVGLCVGGVEKSYEGSAHPGELRVLACLLEDGLVCGVDCGGERGWRILRRGRGGGVDEVLEKGVGGEMAGYFAGGGSAHAIADDKDAVGRGSCTCVLVVLADTAGVSEHCGDEMADEQVSMRP